MESFHYETGRERRMICRNLHFPSKGTLSSFAVLVLFALFSHNWVHLQALSQQSASPPLKPVVYVDIGRWEDRSAYPRFILFRDHFRRHLDSTSSNKDNSALVTYSKTGSDSSSAIVYGPSEKGKHDPVQSSLLTTSYLLNDKDADENEEYSDEDDILSLERLLAERNGIVSKKPISNAKISGDDPSFNNANPGKEIIFPKDKTNPCNRLQINPEEVKKDGVSGEGSHVEPGIFPSNATDSLKEEKERDVDSIEIANRESFFSSGDTHLSNFSSELDDEHEEDIKELIKDAVPTIDLTMNIIKLSGWNEEDVVFSPLSIANVLSMIMLGAGGETFNELATLLDRHNSSMPTSHSIFRYHNAFKKLMTYLRDRSGEKVALSIASQVFVNQSYQVRDEFRNDLQTFYEAPLESFDFGTEGQAFQDQVNRWVQEKTRGQIQTILDEPPPPSTTMGIINAIYFKGPWEIPFNEKLTRWREFQVGPKETTKVQMMVNILSVPYVEREAYKMIALPYRENRTGLYVILPKGNDGIEDLKNVEKILTTEELKESILQLNTTKLAVSLPKLKYSSDGRMEEILRKINLSTVFSPTRANFSGISSEGLYISSLVHRAVIEINEQGTEASAVSLGTGDRIIEDLPIPFRCDKPFLFFIYHVHADTILFWGRVVRPSHLSS